MFDGKNSTRQKLSEKCPHCRKQAVYYVGTQVLHGNPYTPASDTEVEHFYRCEGCQAEWSEYR